MTAGVMIIGSWLKINHFTKPATLVFTPTCLDQYSYTVKTMHVQVGPRLAFHAWPVQGRISPYWTLVFPVCLLTCIYSVLSRNQLLDQPWLIGHRVSDPPPPPPPPPPPVSSSSSCNLALLYFCKCPRPPSCLNNFLLGVWLDFPIVSACTF